MIRRCGFTLIELSLSQLYDPASAEKINSELKSILGGYAGDERRKWGVENSGLCLLLAWTNELIQQRKFVTNRPH
jgi:hypothetical protein